MQGPDHVEDPVLVIQSMVKRYMDYATISQHHIFIKGPRTNIRSWAGLALQFILCVHTFCSLEEFTITALVESQHTSSSYTIDNSPSYSAFRLRKPLGRRACRILQLSDDGKRCKFQICERCKANTWSLSWPKLTRSWSLKFYFFFQQWASQR